MNRKFKLNLRFLASFFVIGLLVSISSQAIASTSNSPREELEILKKEFGHVLNLNGTARKEINAIANLLAPGSKLAAIDITKASGEFCMLETVTKHNMTHFSSNPETDSLRFPMIKSNSTVINSLPSFQDLLFL